MSDTAPTTEAAPETPPAGAEPEGTTPAPTPSAPEGTPPSDVTAAAEATHEENAQAALDGDKVAFDALPPAWQAEVRRLRDESAENRVKAKRYEEPLSALDEHEQEFMLSLARDLGNPETQAAAARRMAEVAQALLEGVEPPEAETKPLTLADLERIETERRTKAESEAQIQAVFTEAEELGYKKDTPDFALLMWEAANAAKPEEAGDLQAAHKRIAAYRQGLIDQWVAEQKAKGTSFITPVGGGAPGTQSDGPKTIAEASARARARADAMRKQLAG